MSARQLQHADRVNGGLALLVVLLALEMQAQAPQRNRGIEIIVPGQALSAVDDIENRLARECSTVAPGDISQIRSAITWPFIGVGPLAFRIRPVASRVKVQLLQRAGRFGGEDVTAHCDEQDSGPDRCSPIGHLTF